MTSARFSSAVVVVLTVMCSKAVGQASPCRAEADSVAKLTLVVEHVYQWSDSAATVTLGLPWTRVQNIVLVTDSTTCAAAVASYNAALGVAGTSQADTSGYVYSLGGAGYAYVRPGDAIDAGLYAVYLFSPSWVFKGRMMA